MMLCRCYWLYTSIKQGYSNEFRMRRRWYPIPGHAECTSEVIGHDLHIACICDMVKVDARIDEMPSCNCNACSSASRAHSFPGLVLVPLLSTPLVLPKLFHFFPVVVMRKPQSVFRSPCPSASVHSLFPLTALHANTKFFGPHFVCATTMPSTEIHYLPFLSAPNLLSGTLS
jgi:hypothetical protein